MRCKYCLQTNVVKNGQLSYDQYYRCRSCNRYFRRTLLDDVNPKVIQSLLNNGVHKYAIARKYGCTHTVVNRYIKEHKLIEQVEKSSGEENIYKK